MRRALRLAVVAVAVAAILLLFVLPGRTFLSQEHSLTATERQANSLSAENAKLRTEAKLLQSNAEIEKIAREEYGLVMPGERAYAVLPATPGSTTPPTTRPGRDTRSGTQRAHSTAPRPNGRTPGSTTTIAPPGHP